MNDEKIVDIEIQVKDITYYFIELPKFRKSKFDLASELECWLALIDDRDGGLVKMAEKKSKVIKEAKEEVEEILSEGVVRELEEIRQKAIFDKNTEVHNAREEGENTAKINIIKEMKKNKISLELIEKITGLSQSEIENIN